MALTTICADYGLATGAKSSTLAAGEKCVSRLCRGQLDWAKGRLVNLASLDIKRLAFYPRRKTDRILAYLYNLAVKLKVILVFVLWLDADSEDSPSSGGILKCHKTKRVRTTFTEEQLQILQANFNIDSNPDGQDLERIAQLTGLSKRVTQVWFQNSRARQKKYGTPLFSASPRTPSSASFWSLEGILGKQTWARN